jgi:LPXTG-motif cell wall-anchored protein
MLKRALATVLNTYLSPSSQKLVMRKTISGDAAEFGIDNRSVFKVQLSDQKTGMRLLFSKGTSTPTLTNYLFIGMQDSAGKFHPLSWGNRDWDYAYTKQGDLSSYANVTDTIEVSVNKRAEISGMVAGRYTPIELDTLGNKQRVTYSARTLSFTKGGPATVELNILNEYDRRGFGLGDIDPYEEEKPKPVTKPKPQPLQKAPTPPRPNETGDALSLFSILGLSLLAATGMFFSLRKKKLSKLG